MAAFEPMKLEPVCGRQCLPSGESRFAYGGVLGAAKCGDVHGKGLESGVGPGMECFQVGSKHGQDHGHQFGVGEDFRGSSAKARQFFEELFIRGHVPWPSRIGQVRGAVGTDEEAARGLAARGQDSHGCFEGKYSAHAVAKERIGARSGCLQGRQQIIDQVQHIPKQWLLDAAFSARQMHEAELHVLGQQRPEASVGGRTRARVGNHKQLQPGRQRARNLRDASRWYGGHPGVEVGVCLAVAAAGT